MRASFTNDSQKQRRFQLNNDHLEYAGFWSRMGAFLIDAILLAIIIYPLLIAIYGWEIFASTSMVNGPADFLISWVFPFIATILFWLHQRATPGKMAISAQVVDAQSGDTITFGQALLRYLGYFLSMIPLGLGLLWVAFDSRKQGWHDKIAGTVVVKKVKTGPEPVQFNRR